MRKLNDNECKKVMLEMANVIHEICLANDIKYSLAYGTLIGAIRHGGFIPWDDDFDIFLTRKNYEKLIMALKKLDDFYLLDLNDNGYNLNFAKLCHKRYVGEFLDKKHEIYFKNFGIFIDIFCLDEIDKDQKDNHFLKLRNLLKSIEILGNPSHERSDENLVRKIAKRLIFLPKVLYYKFFLKREKLVKNYQKLEQIFNGTGQENLGILSAGFKEIYQKSDFVDYHLQKFEDYEFMIVKNYDRVLRTYYGDYTQLPPENERVGHHPYAFFDTKI
ncbi:LicD family protein [Campylobacter gastrosuis]|uniref:LicD family protein n=1 Tax=Campylobacter gastrosuis TaxID=2974576 RepID=A0ABT7HQT2_9BACT|nr:LicD family protein [Campylobacter gastrosuis]MDL0089286.1 LicD family protein [Campylobacter gastrosuis]